jgi:hypothetical protein
VNATRSRSLQVYPFDQLYEEMAFIAFHFHWARDQLMTLEHGERRRWCKEISSINRRLNDSASVGLLDVT